MQTEVRGGANCTLRKGLNMRTFRALTTICEILGRIFMAALTLILASAMACFTGIVARLAPIALVRSRIRESS